MMYVNFEKHHYGLYVKYVDARVRIVLVENKKRVCDLSTLSDISPISAFGEGRVYVEQSKDNFKERILQEAGCHPTGVVKHISTSTFVEYDVGPLVKLNDREMKRNQMKKGMVQLGENIYVSSSVIYYAYHSKVLNEYRIVTTESLIWNVDKKFFIEAIKEFNIPVYKNFRKEPF